MEKPKQEKWWTAGSAYNNDVRKKLQMEGCGSIKRSLIQCRVEKQPDKECDKLAQEMIDCENMLLYVGKYNEMK